MVNLFIQVLTSDRLPKDDGGYISCSVNGVVVKRSFYKKHNSFCHNDTHGDLTKTISVEWWLEEIELPDTSQFKPCDEDAHDQYNEHSDVYDAGYSDGFKDGKVEGINYLLNHLK